MKRLLLLLFIFVITYLVNGSRCLAKSAAYPTNITPTERHIAKDIPLADGNCSVNLATPDDFIITIRTDNPGASNDDQFLLPLDPGQTYDFSIDWDNDGIIDEPLVTGQLPAHTYPSAGTYTIVITDNVGDGSGFPRIFFNGAPNQPLSDAEKLLFIDQWGSMQWSSMASAFHGCSNMNLRAPDVPNLSMVTSLNSMFENCSLFNGDIGNWNVSNIRSSSAMFEGCTSFNADIGNWIVSEIRTMRDMFNGATSFNQDLGNWDLSRLNDMSEMLDNSGLDTEAYDNTLIGWASTAPNNITLGADGLTYCNSETQREDLIDNNGWTINGDDIDCDICNEDIELGSQEEVDAFVADLQVAGCTVFESDRMVLDNSAGGTPINDISGLSIITNTTQNMVISIESTDLANLNGIQGFLLQDVSVLEIEFNDQLTDLSALNGLSTADQIVFGTNNVVTDMSGFSGLTACRLFTIRTNQELTSLNGLQNLEEITGLFTIEQNNLLSDFCALQPWAANNPGLGGVWSADSNAYNPTFLQLQNPTTCANICSEVSFTDPDLEAFFLDSDSYDNGRILGQNRVPLMRDQLVVGDEVCTELADRVYFVILDGGYQGRIINSLGGLEFFTNLIEFDATNAFLEGDIDLRPITSLVQFNASDNNISSVTASNVNNNLQRISLENQGPAQSTLTSINISETINSMTTLEVGSNSNLLVLDLTLFPNLDIVRTSFTGITELDFSAFNSTFLQIDVNDSPLNSLNLRNNNFVYSDISLIATNTNLLCIQVNDGQEALAQEQVDFNVWGVDPGVTFNTDCNTPVASIEANIANASEAGPVNGQFTVRLSSIVSGSGPVTVNYTVLPSSTATPNVDYTVLTETVEILDGTDSATIDVLVANNDDADDTETVVVRLEGGTGYTVGTPDIATVIIQNDLEDISDGVPNIGTNTFQVRVTANSCRGQENGIIALVIGNISNSFNAVLEGDNRTLSANSTELFEGRSSGEYSLTITSTEFPGWSQVFRVTVGEAAALDLQGVTIDEEQNMALIRVIGSKQYTVTNNGKEYDFDGFSDDVPTFIEVPIENGLNDLTIKGEKACQGIFSEQLYFGELFAYPIPTSDFLKLEGLPQQIPLELLLFDITGKLVHQEKWENAWPGRSLNITSQEPGKYFLRITGKGIEENVQLLKR